MNVLDSSAWLEYSIDGPLSARVAAQAEDTDKLLVPMLCLYELMRTTTREVDATLWTLDADFAGLAGVVYLTKLP